jgi:hypothetical protein
MVKMRDLGERLVLIPVAQSVPAEHSDQHATAPFQETEKVNAKSQLKNSSQVSKQQSTQRTFWFVGEQYENSCNAWKSVASSAMAIVNEISFPEQAKIEPLPRQVAKKGVGDAILEKS